MHLSLRPTSHCAIVAVAVQISLHLPLCPPTPSMSAAHPPAAAIAATRAPSKQRPRHFWEGPRPAVESAKEKQGAGNVSPITRLYRHALESVFGFLALADLSRVLSVSREWAEAVRSMKSIGAEVTSKRVRPWMVATSPLAPHVKHLGSFDRLLETSDALVLLSRPPISLLSLACEVDLSVPSRLFLGVSLRSLTIRLRGNPEDVPAINDAIVTISRLPFLSELDLWLPSFFPEISFAPLAGAAQLQELCCAPNGDEEPSHDQLDQLRMLPKLRTMKVHNLCGEDLLYLLRAPHALQWQQIHLINEIDDDEATALSNLPTLTDLDTDVCRSVTFLPALICLRKLHLWIHSDGLAAEIAAGLSCCSQLRELLLGNVDDLTSLHLSQVLPHLPLLRELRLWSCDALNSLSFFSKCVSVVT